MMTGNGHETNCEPTSCNHFVALHSMIDALEACPDPCCRVALCQAIDICLAGCVVPTDPMPVPDGAVTTVRGLVAPPAGFSWAQLAALIRQANALGVPWREIAKILMTILGAAVPSLQPLIDLINGFLAKQAEPQAEPAKAKK